MNSIKKYLQSTMIIIGVIGPGESSPETDILAEETGFEIGKLKAITLNGGLRGVMEASAKGAKRAQENLL